MITKYSTVKAKDLTVGTYGILGERFWIGEYWRSVNKRSSLTLDQLVVGTQRVNARNMRSLRYRGIFPNGKPPVYCTP